MREVVPRAASSCVCANDFLLNGSLRGFDLRSRQPPVHKSARCNARGVIAITLWTGPAEWFMAELIPISGIRLTRPDSSCGMRLPRFFLSAFALSPPSVPPLIRDFTANFINANCKHIGQIEKRFRKNVSFRAEFSYVRLQFITYSAIYFRRVFLKRAYTMNISVFTSHRIFFLQLVPPIHRSISPVDEFMISTPLKLYSRLHVNVNR